MYRRNSGRRAVPMREAVFRSAIQTLSMGLNLGSDPGSREFQRRLDAVTAFIDGSSTRAQRVYLIRRIKLQPNRLRLLAAYTMISRRTYGTEVLPVGNPYANVRLRQPRNG
jgi:hypothetical protein